MMMIMTMLNTNRKKKCIFTYTYIYIYVTCWGKKNKRTTMTHAGSAEGGAIEEKRPILKLLLFFFLQCWALAKRSEEKVTNKRKAREVWPKGNSRNTTPLGHNVSTGVAWEQQEQCLSCLTKHRCITSTVGERWHLHDTFACPLHISPSDQAVYNEASHEKTAPSFFFLYFASTLKVIVFFFFGCLIVIDNEHAASTWHKKKQQQQRMEKRRDWLTTTTTKIT